MSMKKEEQKEVKFINSLSLAVVDKDNEVRHIQLSIVQNIDDGMFQVFFDVVDPSKIKLEENGVS